VAAAIAALGALPFVRQSAAVVGHYLPQNETSALSEADFVGRTAQIVTGEASSGNPAEARLVDEYGQPHYLRIEPDDAEVRFARGSTVLIVSRVSGSLYRAIANPRPDLL